jgi:plastocyanin
MKKEHRSNNDFVEYWNNYLSPIEHQINRDLDVFCLLIYRVLNNIIAIIVISFVVVGTLWGIGNLINRPEESSIKNISGVLLIAQNNAFNKTNPDIYSAVNVPKKLVVVNKDFVRHDLVVDELKINTAYLSSEQDFTTAIASKEPGIFEYYCSLHPTTMQGKIIVNENND